MFASLPTGAKIALGILGGIAALALAVWLFLFNGLNVVLSALPPGVVKLIGEKPGEQKVMPVVAERAPWETHKAYTARKNGERPGAEPSADDSPGKVDDDEVDDTAEEPAAPAKTDEQAAAELTMAPIRSLGARADEAIAAYQDDASDQALFLAANQAIEAIKAVEIQAETEAVRVAAVEYRAELVTQKRKTLEESRRAGRATHRVAGTAGNKSAPYLTLREAASSSSDDVGHVSDGQLLRVHLDAGGGWQRVEVLTGPTAGKYGYARGKQLLALKKKRTK